MNTIVFDTPELLAKAAAELWLKLSREAIDTRGRFSVSLSGGSTPKRLFTLLASEAWRNKIDWENTWLFFGDERYVDHHHPDSNFRMASETLLTRVNAKHVFPVPTAGNDQQQNADAYAQTLKAHLGDPPVFDLVFLGLGADGHTASLFPDTGATDETHRDAIAVYVKKLDSWRISLTLPLINRARNTVFLVEGEGKADIIQEIIQLKPDTYPAEKVRTKQLHWYLDSAAASKLK